MNMKRRVKILDAILMEAWGFHDASWQRLFGGSRYLTNGSHGCVNMPPEMAAKLFDLISAGTPVVYIIREKEIEHV